MTTVDTLKNNVLVVYHKFVVLLFEGQKSLCQFHFNQLAYGYS